jgi:ureidoacrylate peracid hydrolase
LAEPIHHSRTAEPFRLGASPGQGWQVAPDRISTLRPEPASRPASFAARPRAVEIDLTRTAVIAVDLQNDFLHGEGWFAQAGRQGRAPIERIDAFARGCRSAGLPVVWLNWGLPGTAAHLPASTLYRGKREADAIGYGERPTGRDEGTLHAGSWGAALADGLTREPDDHEVHKQRFSGFPDTHLDSLLRRMGVSTLLFCGINTDRCVFETLTDAAALGYDCVLLTDLCATVSPPAIEAAVVWLVETLHGFVAESPDLLAALSPVPPAQEA